MSDLDKYPVYQFIGGEVVRLRVYPKRWNSWEWQAHHYIPRNWIKNHKEEFKEIEHLQKIIFLPSVCHQELHARHSKFKEKYGIEIKELLWNV